MSLYSKVELLLTATVICLIALFITMAAGQGDEFSSGSYAEPWGGDLPQMAFWSRFAGPAASYRTYYGYDPYAQRWTDFRRQ